MHPDLLPLVASLILDAIKRLILAKVWELNRPGSPIWISTAGVFIKWADACPEAIQDVLASGVKGIPRSADSLAAILIDHGIAKADSSGDVYWSIAIHMLRKRDYDDTKKDIWLRCLFIPDLHHIFSFEQRPAPVSISVKAGNEVTDYLIEKSAVDRPGKSQANSTVSDAEPTTASTDAQKADVSVSKGAATQKSSPKGKSAKPSSDVAGSNLKGSESKPAIADEVRNALGMSSKDKTNSSSTALDGPIGSGVELKPDEPLVSQATEDPSEPIEDVADVEVEMPSIEDMLVAMDLLTVKSAPAEDLRPAKRDLLKDVLKDDVQSELPLVVTSEVVNLPVESKPTAIADAVDAVQKLGTFKLSVHAKERAQAEFNKLSAAMQEKVRKLFEECSEERKYTPEMRVEIPVDEDRFSEEELHELIDSGLIFKSPIEGYTGLTNKFRKNWLCLSYDAAFLMSDYDDALVPFDVEIPEIERGTLKRIVQKYCLPEVDEANRSFYNLNKKAQLDVAQYLSITNVELLNIFRVNYGSVRPSTSRATEIVFFGE